MTREALDSGAISEDSITTALIKTRGDLFLTASMLGCSVRELDGYIRTSEPMMAFFKAVLDVKHDPEYQKATTEQFEDRIEYMTRHFQMEGLQIVHELATTLPSQNASLAETKLKAATYLASLPVSRKQEQGQQSVLAELNDLYRNAAPRIKSVRLAQIEFEQDQRVIDAG